MKNLKFLLLFAAASLLGFAACNESGDTTEPKDPVVELKADKTSIEATGEDVVTFTVYVDEKEATIECTIINLKDNSTLEGNTYTTTEEGEHSFKALFGKYSSNSVTIVAVPAAPMCIAPTLTADKSEIKADGEDYVTFTVTDNGEDVTAEARIINLTTETELEGNTFSATEVGEYKFMAECDNPLPSAVITINVVALEEPEPTPEVILVADKSEIKADGEDVVTFTVTFGEEDVTAKSRIINLTTKSELEGNTYTTTEAGAYKFTAMYEGSIEPAKEIIITATEVEAPAVPVVTLETDKSEIIADGEDKVTFTVKVDGEAVSEGFEIINVADGKALAATEFTTTTAGEYQFKAKVGDAESEVVKITATEPEPEPVPVVTLETDKSEIIADGEDKVTFTVKVDDKAVSEGFEIINLADNKALTAAEFTTTTAGEYQFKAKVGDVESEVVKITATEPEPEPEPSIVLSADKTTIVADGVDAVTFCVEVEDILTEDTLVIINLADNSEVDGTFTTTTAGTYSFKATKGGVESNVVTVTATEVEEPEPTPPSSKYNIGDVIECNGSKGIVYAFKDIAVYDDSYENIIRYDTYCYVMSLDQTYVQWSTENVQCGCFNPADGSKNVMSIKYVDSTLEKYPAAKWCEDHGEGWYLPASNELHMLWDAVSGNKHVFKNNPDVEKFNKALTDNGGTAIEETFYWTSNEVSDSIAEVVCFSDGKGVCLNIEKSMQYDVRAIYKFKIK